MTPHPDPWMEVFRAHRKPEPSAWSHFITAGDTFMSRHRIIHAVASAAVVVGVIVVAIGLGVQP